LWLLDALYFTCPVFRLLRREKAHLLIKLKDAEYRQVTQDAANLFQHFGGDQEARGVDPQRLCSWTARQTLAAFAGFPVQVVHLQEFYLKRRHDPHVQCWIVTTELSLSLEEIRQAAHLRWQIENNLFKRLNHLAGTKRFRVKDPRAFFNWLHLLCAAVGLLHALIGILSRHARVFKALLAGAKFTWRNLFARLAEACEGPLLPPH
jgi:IS4 transposase